MKLYCVRSATQNEHMTVERCKVVGRAVALPPPKSTKQVDEETLIWILTDLKLTFCQDPLYPFTLIGILIDLPLDKERETWSCEILFGVQVLAQKFFRNLYRMDFFNVT